MSGVSKHWNMPWHAWLKSLAQTSKSVGAPHFAAASDWVPIEPALGPGGSWMIRARGRTTPMTASTL